MTRTGASLIPLDSGAEARVTNTGAPLVALLANGGTAKPVPGTWSAMNELLAEQLAPRFPGVAFVELRYRVKTWKALDSCLRDAEAALDVAAAGGRPCLLVGFSMGGAVSIGVAGHPGAHSVLGLAPWIPQELSLQPLDGKRFDVVHGAWDRYLPGVPGVSPDSSWRGFERALESGASGTYTLIPRGLHGAAVRGRSGAIVRLPRWRSWVAHTAAALELFQASASGPSTGSLRRSS